MINYDESVISYNKQAMSALKNDQKAVAFNLLKQAQRLLKTKQVHNQTKLKSLTFNNLGCFYKRCGDFHQALSFFIKALDENPEDVLTKSGVLLNLCNIYSLLINHPKALSSALQALELLQSIKEDTETYNFTLLKAYQTIANEQENLSQYEIAKSFLKKALNLALKKFPDTDYAKRIREKIEVLIGKLLLCTDQNLFSFRKKIRTKNHSSFTPTPVYGISKVEKSSFFPLNFTIQKKGRHPKLPMLKDRAENFRIVKKSFGRFVDSEKSSTRERVKTTLPSSRNKKKEKNLKLHSKTPEIFPVPFKMKLSLVNSK